MPQEIGTLREPTLSKDSQAKFNEGIRLFNRKAYWDAHESWEEIWQTLGDGPEDDWEILLRGLIQFAAALHGLSTGKLAGGIGNLKKSKSKLELHQGLFLGIDLMAVVSAISKSIDSPEQLLAYKLVRQVSQ